MSRSKTYNITCPSCGAPREIELYESINAQTDPHLKQALMLNTLNRVECTGCETNFRVDMPLLYSDPEYNILIHWVPETDEKSVDQIIEEFDQTLEQINEMLPEDVDAPSVRLVMTRVELVELIYMIEAKLNQRVIEYVKYSIYTRNMEAVDPHRFRLLLNVEDSNDDELCFVVQDVAEQTLGNILKYGRAAFNSMCELYVENRDEFIEMFPGPCISARQLLLEDEEEVET